MATLRLPSGSGLGRQARSFACAAVIAARNSASRSLLEEPAKRTKAASRKNRVGEGERGRGGEIQRIILGLGLRVSPYLGFSLSPPLPLSHSLSLRLSISSFLRGL